jgi:hypothetical protein
MEAEAQVKVPVQKKWWIEEACAIACDVGRPETVDNIRDLYGKFEDPAQAILESAERHHLNIMLQALNLKQMMPHMDSVEEMRNWLKPRMNTILDAMKKSAQARANREVVNGIEKPAGIVNPAFPAGVIDFRALMPGGNNNEKLDRIDTNVMATSDRVHEIDGRCHDIRAYSKTARDGINVLTTNVANLQADMHERIRGISAQLDAKLAVVHAEWKAVRESIEANVKELKNAIAAPKIDSDNQQTAFASYMTERAQQIEARLKLLEDKASQLHTMLEAIFDKLPEKKSKKKKARNK